MKLTSNPDEQLAIPPFGRKAIVPKSALRKRIGTNWHMKITVLIYATRTTGFFRQEKTNTNANKSKPKWLST